MDRQEWQQVEEIVDTALSLSETEREAYIEKACRNNPDLEKKVKKLLENIEKAEGTNYLESDDKFDAIEADFLASNQQDAGKSLVGAQIGPYKIRHLIGHGGMASVFLAERADEAFEATVAFKIMRRGLDTPSNIARFKRERNILARLDHPNIAKLLDGGVTDEGLPYLVMEYVEGTPLLDYCDKHRLTLTERLSLFKSICRAVQYAHKNAVIHRDLKASNILVTSERQVKILDFGIAKLQDAQDEGQSRFQTREESRILTPGYASPEQLENIKVTTATDVYTLGTLLYELLAGVHPYPLQDKKFSEIEQLIRNQTPDRPSTRLANLLSEDQRKIAGSRSTDPSALLEQLRGDLDAIVMKALRKETRDRYHSPGQLLEDLHRREQNKPVVAREDTVRYKVRKYIKRHKNGLMTAAATFLIIAGIVGYYTMQLAEQKNQAQLEAQKAEQVTSFLIDLIESNYPENAQGDTITVRQFLDRGYQKVRELNRSPAVKANIMQVMAHTYQSLGKLNKADTLITRVINMQDTVQIKEVEQAKSFNLYGLILRDKGEIKKAEEAMVQSMNLYQSIGKTKTPKFANLLRDLAYIKRINGNYDEALQLARHAIRIEKQIYGKQDINLAETYYVLASILRHQKKYKQAQKNQLRSLQIVESEVQGPHPGKMTNYNNLAIIYDKLDSLQKAKTYYQKSLSMSRQLFGKRHPDMATTYSNLSSILLKEGKMDSAEVLIKRALKMTRQTSGSDHPNMAEMLKDYANICRQRSQYGKADSLYAESLNVLRKNFDEDHPQISSVKYSKAVNAQQMGNIKAAEQLLKEVLSLRRNNYKPQDEAIQAPLDMLINILKQQRRFVEIDSLRQRFSKGAVNTEMSVSKR